MSKKNEVFFNIDSKILFELGEKLVINRAVALVELVKNSYDADATKVTIQMKDVKKQGGTIIIKDNGRGMSLSRFKETWMRIATTEKEKNPISKKYKRRKAGEKGIGRFACRRLSNKLVLKTISKIGKRNKEELNAVFNWPKFTPGTDVNEVPIEYTIKRTDKGEIGTTLILENTRDSWSWRDINKLREELTSLVSPTTLKEKRINKKIDPGFNIEFDLPEFESKTKPLDKTFFINAWAKLFGHIDKNGITEYKIEVIKKIENKIKKTFKRKERFKNLKNVNFQIHIFVYSSEFFKDSEWALSKARQISTEKGGIKVYADSFRIFGYGESGDDWLKIDRDRARSRTVVDKEVSIFAKEAKRPGLHLFRNQALFGHVLFSKEDNPKLEISINRERLIKNKAFEELKQFVRLGIDFATILYANEIVQKEKKKKEKKRKEGEKVQEEVKEEIHKIEELIKKSKEKIIKAKKRVKKIEEKIKRIEGDKKELEKTHIKLGEKLLNVSSPKYKNKIKDILQEEQKNLKLEKGLREEEKKARKELEKIQDESENIILNSIKESIVATEKLEEIYRQEVVQEKEEIKHIMILAATGTLILIFGHEIIAFITNIEELIKKISPLLQKPKKIKEETIKELEKYMKELKIKKEMMKEMGSLIGLISSRESRLERKEWVLLPIVKEVFKPFREYLKETIGIKYEFSIHKALRTPEMHRSEIFSILHNLLTNSVKALKEVEKRKIEVRALENNKNVCILFLDTGIGVKKERREKVFEMFESTSEPDMEFGVGTGLGLYLIREITRSYGGDVKFIDAPKGWKTCVEIILPKDVKK